MRTRKKTESYMRDEEKLEKAKLVAESQFQRQKAAAFNRQLLRDDPNFFMNSPRPFVKIKPYNEAQIPQLRALGFKEVR